MKFRNKIYPAFLFPFSILKSLLRLILPDLVLALELSPLSAVELTLIFELVIRGRVNK